LDKITTGTKQNTAYFELIERAEKSEALDDHTRLMRKIMKLAFTDRNIKRLNDSILEIEAEMDKGIGDRKDAFRYSDLAKELLEGLKQERTRLVDEAGARARQKLETERDFLRELLQQALRIKIETSRKEREFLESALAKGGQVDIVRKYRFSVAVSDEH